MFAFQCITSSVVTPVNLLIAPNWLSKGCLPASVSNYFEHHVSFPISIYLYVSAVCLSEFLIAGKPLEGQMFKYFLQVED